MGEGWGEGLREPKPSPLIPLPTGEGKITKADSLFQSVHSDKYEMIRRTILYLIITACAVALTAAQTRRRKRVTKPPANQQAPRGTADKYSHFLHSSEKHRSLTCDACHKVPTVWAAKREFPDVADFPDHEACVRCHRQQFFTGQSLVGTGPAICTVCHLRAAPREEARFSFGKPNNSNQPTKPKDERQFAIEFPHDKHQNVIASFPSRRLAVKESPALADARATAPVSAVRFVHASFTRFEFVDDKPNTDYNNCSICHLTNKNPIGPPPAGWQDSFAPPIGTFKTRPNAHDACFDCHWKNQKPAGDDCSGCHKLSAAFVPADLPKRISIKFSHEGGKGGHVMECTTCHINITRASTLRGLTPDVPITICATCHKDNKKITYPNITTIEEEFEQFKKTGNCAYCHTSEVGKKKAPLSHDAAAQ